MALGPKELGSWANDSNLSIEIRARTLGKSRKVLLGTSDAIPADTDGTDGTHVTYGSPAAGFRPTVPGLPDVASRLAPRSLSESKRRAKLGVSVDGAKSGDRGVSGVTRSDDGPSVLGLGLGLEKGWVGLESWLRAAG